jgi:anti-anti-sigma factor
LLVLSRTPEARCEKDTSRRIDMSAQPGVEVLVAGTKEIDRHTVADFLAELEEALRRYEASADRSPGLVVDFSQVTFLDSNGIRALLDTAAATERRGGHWVVRGGYAGVRRCLDITGVLERFGDVSANGNVP